MGNYLSCTLAAPLIRNARAARVVLPSGEVRQFRNPTKAAEVMLDFPNFFLADARSFQIGKRFSPLIADEDLDFGCVYVMFPMRRIASVITAADMAVLFLAANSAAKRIGMGESQKKDDMDVGFADHENRNSERDSEERPKPCLEEFQATAELRYKPSVARSRKPMLETIKEEAWIY